MGGMTCRFVGDTVEEILVQVKEATFSVLGIPLWPDTELVILGPDFDPNNPKKDAIKIFKINLTDEDDGYGVSFTEVEKGRIWHVSLLKDFGGLEPKKWTASISFRK